jgi:rod shape-determining protein MreC
MKLSSKLKNGIIIVLIVIFFLVLNLTSFGKEVKNFFYLISSPIQKTLWRVGDRISDFFEMVGEMKNLKKENEELKSKIQEMQSEKVAMIELKKENETLRKALGIGLEKEFKLIFARVIGKDISQDSILIDKGLEDGVLKNLPVITEEKILVGSVEEVYKKFSRVRLISNKESSFDAKVVETLPQNESGPARTEIYGIVKGKGNFKLFLDLIPKEKEIKEGDFVITSPLAGIFPGGILVGEITEVKKSDVEPFQKAEIKPAFDIREITTLFIIANK